MIAREQFSGPEETRISIANRTHASYFIELQGSHRRSTYSDPGSINLARLERRLDAWLS